MLARYCVGPVALFLVQVAPVGLHRDETGRFRLAFGGALGRYQETSVDCEGNVTDRQNFKFRTVGGEAEAYVAPKLRVTAHAGNMSTTAGEGNLAPPFQGFFAGALMAWEGEKSGIGAGAAREPLPDLGVPGATAGGRLIPMAYLRFGRLEKVHTFLESGGPSAPGGPPERIRMGIGSGWGPTRRVGVRATLGTSAFPDGNGVNLALLLRFPLSQDLDLGVSGVYRNPNGGNFGVFGRVTWGTPAPRP